MREERRLGGILWFGNRLIFGKCGDSISYLLMVAASLLL